MRKIAEINKDLKAARGKVDKVTFAGTTYSNRRDSPSLSIKMQENRKECDLVSSLTRELHEAQAELEDYLESKRQEATYYGT